MRQLCPQETPEGDLGICCQVSASRAWAATGNTKAFAAEIILLLYQLSLLWVPALPLGPPGVFA